MILSQNKTYAIVMTCLVLTAVLLVCLTYGIFSAIVSGSAKIILDKKEVAAMELQNNMVGDFKIKYQEYRPDLQKAEELFVDSANPINFIKFLEAISASAGVNAQISIVPFVKSDNKNVRAPISFQINVEGEYENIVKFTQKLEAGSYLVEVTNAVIKKVEKSDLDKKAQQATLQASFLIEALPK